jgi:hypothetical protein
MGGLAPDHFEPQPPEGPGLWHFLADEAIQRDAVIHASPVSQDAHPDLHPRCLPEQRLANLARTLDDVPAKLVGVHVLLPSPNRRSIPGEILRAW